MRTSAEGTLPATAISLEQTAPSPEDRPGNVAEIHRRLELAHSGYIVAPGVVAAAAETVDGPFVSGLVDRLRGTDTLVAAGMCEKEGNSYFNTVVVLGQDGVLLRYRKVHLFDEEQVAYTPGDQLPIVETRHGVLGVCVCYDLRFVEVMRLLALQGAEIVIAPAAWVRGFDTSVPPVGGREPLVPQARGAVVHPPRATHP